MIQFLKIQIENIKYQDICIIYNMNKLGTFNI